MKDKKTVALFGLAVAAVLLTSFGPLAKQTTAGLFSTYSNPVTLFGSAPGVVIALTLIVEIMLLGFCAMIYKQRKMGFKGLRITSIFLLVMQIMGVIYAIKYYDTRSLMGAIRSEISENTLHPVYFLTLVVTVALIVLSFRMKATEEENKTT